MSVEICRGALYVYVQSNLHVYRRPPFMLLYFSGWKQKHSVLTTSLLLLTVSTIPPLSLSPSLSLSLALPLVILLYRCFHINCSCGHVNTACLSLPLPPPRCSWVSFSLSSMRCSFLMQESASVPNPSFPPSPSLSLYLSLSLSLSLSLMT